MLSPGNFEVSKVTIDISVEYPVGTGTIKAAGFEVCGPTAGALAVAVSGVGPAFVCKLGKSLCEIAS